MDETWNYEVLKNLAFIGNFGEHFGFGDFAESLICIVEEKVFQN